MKIIYRHHIVRLTGSFCNICINHPYMYFEETNFVEGYGLYRGSIALFVSQLGR